MPSEVRSLSSLHETEWLVTSCFTVVATMLNDSSPADPAQFIAAHKTLRHERQRLVTSAADGEVPTLLNDDATIDVYPNLDDVHPARCTVL